MEQANIILSPHFDDAVLSLGGMLAQSGSSTMVVTFFAGIPPKPLIRPWDVLSGFKNSDAAMRERTKENERSLLSFGLAERGIKNYPYLDQQYRSLLTYVGKPERELTEQIQSEIEKILAENRRANIFAPGLEMHHDHALVKQAFLNVFKSGAYGDAVYYLYQDLPYAAWAIKRYGKGFERIKELVAGGEFDVREQAIELSEQDIQKKVAGIRLYASQVAPLGGDVVRLIESFALDQARHRSLRSSHCEVVYQLS